MALSLPNFPPFAVHESAPDVRWKKWLHRLENLLVALDVKNVKRQRALLLHYAGEEVNEIFETLPDTGDDYKTAVQKLTEYLAPKKNREFEVYGFRQAKQQTDETVDTFHTRLRQLSMTCEFQDTDTEIKSQIIQGCSSTRLRRRALREEMNITQLLTLARSLELSDKQAAVIEKSDREDANAISKTHKRNKHRRNQPRYLDKKETETNRKPQSKQVCRNCGGEFPHRGKPCPAKGKICNYCKRQNHFADVCRYRLNKTTKNSVNQVDDAITDDSETDEDYVYGVQAEQTVNSVRSKQPRTAIRVNELEVQVMIDTGSSINVMDENTYQRFDRQPKLKKAKTIVYAYGDTQLPVIGEFQATIESSEKITTAPFFVVKGHFGNLLCYETAVQLQIMPTICAMKEDKVSHLCEEYVEIFRGIGKLKDTKVKLHIDDTIHPVSQPHRRIPFHVRKQVEKELERLEKLDIIEKVDGPTPWVSPIVVAPKPKSPGEIRICVDMRLPNTAVQRERHITPTIDDMILDLNGSKVFSKLDLNSGYHQLELEESSRHITTFSTHVGLRRYKRLIFGVSSAAEIFQNTLRNALDGLDGVRNISDDIIVFGQTQKEHDERLEATFKRLQEKHITLNRAKCEFNKDKLEFYGYVFSKDGISPDPKKVAAIKDATPPKNVSEVRSFLGMTNYVGRFIPNYSTITEPLRALTKQTVPWKWTKREQDAFDKLKTTLSSETVMSYFDQKKDTTLVVDASPVGLGAILTQEGKVIAYASRALTDVERRYSQTEREGLAIVWSCEHFHLYLLGKSFTLISDHKPLELIFNNPKSRPAARIERWTLRLQSYHFKVIYKSGKSNAADYMSRHPENVSDTVHSDLAEEFVCYISNNAVPKAMKMEEICKATSGDNDLQQVLKAIKTENWEKSYNGNSSMETFSRLRNELTVVETKHGAILLRDKRLVIPKTLQYKAIQLAHEGHQGIVKTKQLLREKVWFPGIDKQVENICKTCLACLAATPKTNTEPLQMTDLPDSPWNQVSMDFCGPFPSGDYLLVIIDDYSRYPVVEIIKSTASRTVIPQLDKIFAMFGIPEIVKTDNGPPFNGNEFANFADYMGFKHRKVTPLWPQANGEAERFMRTIGKSIRAAHSESRSWKQEIYNFLRNYRTTPHATTGVPPSDLLMNRKIRTKIPVIGEKTRHKQVRDVDKENKRKMKTRADKTRHAKQSQIKTGDNVLVKQRKQDKLSPPFDPKPYEVIGKKGSMITAKREDREVTRNSSHFKPVPSLPPIPPTNEQAVETEGSVENNELRRSTRLKKPPEYLKDYICG